MARRKREGGLTPEEKRIVKALLAEGWGGRAGDEVRLNTPPMNFGGKTIDSYLKWRKL